MGEELWKKWWKEMREGMREGMREEMDGYAALTIPTHPYVSCRRPVGANSDAYSHDRVFG